MSRKAFVADEAMRERVRYLAGVGVSQDDIARIIGCDPKTLRKRLRDELDRGVAEANATVCGYLFAAAKAGNISAIIFWLKTRAHWRERPAEEAVPHRAVDETNSPVLVLPDNSRDAELTQVLRMAQEDYFARKSAAPAARKFARITEPQEERSAPTEPALGDSDNAACNPIPGSHGQGA
jgi:hypothetical protein